jgi:hypothetical protein
MNINSLNGLPASFLQSTLANQLTTNSLTKSSEQSSNSGTSSPFAQLLNDASAAYLPSSKSSTSASQSFNQLVKNFQMSGIQSQGQSLDPMSIGG